MIYITYIVTFIILVFYSVLDIKYREIPAWLLYAGTVVVFALGIASRVIICNHIIGNLRRYMFNGKNIKEMGGRSRL